MAAARARIGWGILAVASLAGIFRLLGAQAYDTNRGDAPVSSYHFIEGSGDLAAPGNARTESGGLIDPKAFPSAEYCSRCHQQAYSEWRQALHSNSFRTPFYRTSVNILARTKGIEFTRHCDSCHNPIGVLSGALSTTSQIDRRFDKDGLTCMTCHSIQALQETKGNGSFVLGVPAVIVDENGKRMPGIVPDEQIMRYPKRHAKAVMQSFYRNAEFCSACHKANLPNPLNGYKWIRAFSAYDEWQNSKFSQQNPLTFYSSDYLPCQGCHMVRETALPTEYGAKSSTFASHRWLAGNTAVPFYYGYKEQLSKTVEFLQSGMFLNVDIFGLRIVKSDELLAPLGSAPFHLSGGELVQALIVIQNKNIGHSLVPEVRDLYEPWVELEIKDAKGKVIYHSGFLNADGTVDNKAHFFRNRPVDTGGNFVDNHKVWTIHSMAYDSSIQSGRSALIRYQFRIPADAASPLTFKAQVNYRHLRASYLNNVLGSDHPTYPIVALASQTRTINVGGSETAEPGAHDNPDWMRWNNLGISYLDQLQYADAIHAFQEVVKLRQDYADGYINLAQTNVEWEKYSEARPFLETALRLSPNSARALYYLALVERREGNARAELADLLAVVQKSPNSRDALRELGISYYQQHQYLEAKKQFETLQRIDPDDLAAHYNLAVIYRRLGMKQEATKQASLFATKQVDPGAPTYSLGYLRKHPEISTESVPWHVHSEALPAPDR